MPEMANRFFRKRLAKDNVNEERDKYNGNKSDELYYVPHGVRNDRYFGKRKICQRHREHLPRGAKYAETEVTDSRRMLTTTVRIRGGLLPLLPVVSANVLPKGKIADCVALLQGVTVQAPVKAGDVIVPDILDLGVNIVASRDMGKAE